MSHFNVLVIGDDIETQLAPYDENIETEPRIDEGDSAEETLKAGLAWLVDPDNTRGGETENALRDKYGNRDQASLTNDEQLEILDWYSGGYQVDPADGQIKRFTTYNPESKWDWYQIGGRWRGFFQLKPGAKGTVSEPHWGETLNGEKPKDVTGLADQARKGDIDFDAMRDKAEAEARESFAQIAEATQGIPLPTESWEQVLDRLGRDKIDQAREEFHKHPWRAAIAEKVGFQWDDPFTRFKFDEPGDPLTNYVQFCRDTAIQTYAMVYKGKWIAKGQMGWFGMSHDSESAVAFGAKQWELIESLPDDTLLTLVDAHI